jgi:arsenate reductase
MIHKFRQMTTPNTKPRILFLCGSNSCRSQMAEGLVNTLWADRTESASAGLAAGRVHPTAIRVMNEIDVDLSGQVSKTVKDVDSAPYDLVVSLCDPAKEFCISPELTVPEGSEGFEKRVLFVGNPAHLHWQIDDPDEATGDDDSVLRAFRDARDALKLEIERLLDGGYLAALNCQRVQMNQVADLL